MAEASDFHAFARRKEQLAMSARLAPLRTVVDNSAEFSLESISTPFTDSVLDGPFLQSPAPAGPLPSIGLVFVQSRDHNTEADDPSALGGGDTDKHVIYEGLSRASADAVVAGSKTVGDGNRVFSVWHPQLVKLRLALGMRRHPLQIVITKSGDLPIATGLLFNVPDVPVIVLCTASAVQHLASAIASRPWISVVSTGVESNLRLGMQRLRSDFGVRRVSAIGGRLAATALIDAGLVDDLYLTTSPISGGVPGTPLYAGVHPPPCRLVVRKESADGVTFEHFVLR
jgi:riboflavin biosynthesis pyrimidine reductase